VASIPDGLRHKVEVIRLQDTLGFHNCLQLQEPVSIVTSGSNQSGVGDGLHCAIGLKQISIRRLDAAFTTLVGYLVVLGIVRC
jgi:hypothetical protein